MIDRSYLTVRVWPALGLAVCPRGNVRRRHAGTVNTDDSSMYAIIDLVCDAPFSCLMR